MGVRSMGAHTRGALKSALEDLGAGLRSVFGSEQRDLIDELLEGRDERAREASHERRRSIRRRRPGGSRPAHLSLVK
jgi:hypothetical protein